MKLLLNYVPNHTSDRHPWFLDARRSRSSKRRDWYIWRDPVPGGGPPNNWRANFGDQLSVGDYAALPAGNDLMAYIRKSGERRFLIALNFSGEPRRFDVAELQAGRAFLRISTYPGREHERLTNELLLRADEGVVVELVRPTCQVSALRKVSASISNFLSSGSTSSVKSFSELSACF